MDVNNGIYLKKGYFYFTKYTANFQNKNWTLKKFVYSH